MFMNFTFVFKCILLLCPCEFCHLVISEFICNFFWFLQLMFISPIYFCFHLKTDGPVFISKWFLVSSTLDDFYDIFIWFLPSLHKWLCFHLQLIYALVSKFFQLTIPGDFCSRLQVLYVLISIWILVPSTIHFYFYHHFGFALFPFHLQVISAHHSFYSHLSNNVSSHLQVISAHHSFYSHPPNNVSSHPQLISAFISKIIFSFIFKRFLLSCPTDFFSFVQNISNLIFNRYLALSINDLNLYLQ